MNITFDIGPHLSNLLDVLVGAWVAIVAIRIWQNKV